VLVIVMSVPADFRNKSVQRVINYATIIKWSLYQTFKICTSDI